MTKTTDEKITYKMAGVDRALQDQFVEKIKGMVGKTMNDQVKGGVGGFAGLYDLQDGRYLAVGSDGVGTKILLACQMGIYNTIGIDLVAMCANDVLCTGARPLFFMDYLATAALELEKSQAIIEGIVEGCLQAKAVLIGGETAEMPGLYAPGHFDLAGFCVGEVEKEHLIDGQKIRIGDALVALPSSGPHSNGLSLIRRLLKDQSRPGERELWSMALEPTRIYVSVISEILKKERALIKGLAHITGSGLLNVPRMNESFDYYVETPFKWDEISPLFSVLKERSGLDEAEMYKTFNMGMGMVVATDRPAQLIQQFNSLGEKAQVVGHIAKGQGRVYLGPERLLLED